MRAKHSAALSLLLMVAVIGLSAPSARSQVAAPSAELRAAARRLTDEALRSHDAYDGLDELCDRIGNRLSGSASLDSAIAWAAARMRAEGLANVHTERVMVPVWVRGHESAEMLVPRPTPLHMLGLGMSVGTPRGGHHRRGGGRGQLPQLDSLGEAGVRGKIVLYDVPFKSYGETVRYRGSGASRAARYGAVAVLVRSVTPGEPRYAAHRLARLRRHAAPHPGRGDHDRGRDAAAPALRARRARHGAPRPWRRTACPTWRPPT